MQQRVCHRGNQKHGGGAFLLNQAADTAGIEASHHHLLQAQHCRDLRASPAVGMKQRNGVEIDTAVVTVESACHHHGVHVNRSMRQHHSLGCAGTSAGVKQLCHRILIDGEDVGALGLSLGDEIFVLGIEVDRSHRSEEHTSELQSL